MLFRSLNVFVIISSFTLSSSVSLVPLSCCPPPPSLPHAHQLEDGEQFAKMVVEMGDKAAEFRAKGFLAIGLVYSLKATDGELATEVCVCLSMLCF